MDRITFEIADRLELRASAEDYQHLQSMHNLQESSFSWNELTNALKEAPPGEYTHVLTCDGVFDCQCEFEIHVEESGIVAELLCVKEAHDIECSLTWEDYFRICENLDRESDESE
ncbi:hypothetical protein [uncultured Pseudodesulfovibrio sp.]|uniref:hypothetical protein n=1 Tax=uncultured Pseudodesulfovibrio sp. TaxID=2035858 RepID=UPI0029C930B7|nr:hypothetical protein [uncultured Pseudodesulfovibrio sp.]